VQKEGEGDESKRGTRGRDEESRGGCGGEYGSELTRRVQKEEGRKVGERKVGGRKEAMCRKERVEKFSFPFRVDKRKVRGGCGGEYGSES
jgi:hypothetical protein